MMIWMIEGYDIKDFTEDADKRVHLARPEMLQAKGKG